MALACGIQPDHSTIAHFVSSMKDEIENIFSNILLMNEAFADVQLYRLLRWRGSGTKRLLVALIISDRLSDY